MKHLILLLGLSLFSNSYGQTQIPDLIIPINFTFQYQYGYPLYMQVGIDSTATDCLDQHLGELELPPVPPPGWGAQMLLPYPQCQNSLGDRIAVIQDFRFGEIPFTGTKTHSFWFRQDVGATIHWNLPNGVTGLLQDNFGGGIVNVPMAGQDSFYVSYNINELNMILSYNNAIPVELTSFTTSVLPNEKVVQLNWSTATETNNSGFEIQKKELGVGSQELEWEAIGFVQGFGTITEPKSYSFIDKNITTGIYKYRLKQIDFDGSFEYSNEIEAKVDFTPKEFVLYQNYPNPFNPNTTIRYQIPQDGFVTLKIYDILGSEAAVLVNEEKSQGIYNVQFTTNNLSSGVYFYQLKTGEFIQSKKMIYLK